MLKRIAVIIENDIKPYLHSHGGDIEALDIDANNNVTLRLLGACSDCSAARSTMEDLVEGILREKLPELGSITLEEKSNSQELLDFALKILRGNSFQGTI
jgi:Fe-S cluster biogenesis protein NfuA